MNSIEAEHFDYEKYQSCMEKLNSLNYYRITNLPCQIVEDLIKNRLTNLINMCKKLGLNESDYSKLNVIHITGTKGKGSTCAFIESILRNSGFKTGHFVSPHLKETRERLKINGETLSYSKFTNYFEYCYKNLVENLNEQDGFEEVSYFGFLTCMMLYVFSRENVQVAIIEVFSGGQYDFTNIIPNTRVCGITSLGLDHCDVLGNTLEEIAWQKSGIFKSTSVAFTLENIQKSALDVIVQRANEKKIPLCLVPHEEQYVDENGKEVELGLNGEVQYINSSLALQIAKYWIDYKNNETLDKSKWIEAHTDRILESNNLPLLKPVFINEPFANGLSKCFWPGRNQIIESENKKVTYYLDGAHTVESIEQFVKWFQSTQPKNPNENSIRNVLLFYNVGDRDYKNFLQQLTKINFSKVAFSELNAFPELFYNNNYNKKLEMVPKLRLKKDNDSKLKILVSTYNEIFNLLSENNSNKESCIISTFDNIFNALLWLTDGKDDCLVNEIETNNHPTSHLQKDIFEVKLNNDSKIHTNVLITGSLYLVGLALQTLNFKF